MKSYSSQIRDEFYRDRTFAVDLLELHLPTPLFLCNGPYDITADTPTAPTPGANTYTAYGEFLGFGSVTEDFEVKVGKLSVYISGLTNTAVELSDPEVSGRRAVIYRSYLNASTGQVVGTPVMLFDGQINNISIVESSRSCTVTLDLSSLFADFERQSGRMTNNESNWLFQGVRYDTTFERAGVIKHRNQMGKNMIIRRPRAEELDRVLILAEYYRDDAGLTDEEYDSDRVAETVRSLMIQPDCEIFCAFEEGRAIGLIAGYLVASPWGRQTFAHIQFLYLLNSHRNMTNARRLVDEFEAWAKNEGCAKVTAGDIGIDPERTVTFYKQCGFRDCGAWLDKEFNQ